MRSSWLAPLDMGHWKPCRFWYPRGCYCDGASATFCLWGAKRLAISGPPSCVGLAFAIDGMRDLNVKPEVTVYAPTACFLGYCVDGSKLQF